MKKWLVGLMAAGLCAASAWADTVTYTVESKSEVSVTGTAPDGASAEYASTYNTKCQLTKDNSMTLTLKGYEGATITGLTLSMKSNAKTGAGSLSATCGDTVIASIADAPFSDESWNGEFKTEYVDVTPSVTETAVTGDIVITIAASANSLYCQSFTIEYEAGEPQFSVNFNKENWFKVALGEASSVTAIPKNGIEPYTFLWDSDTPELKGGTTDTLEIPATLAEGDYTVACLVTEDNGEGDAINALIGFTVAAIPVITGDTYTKVTSLDDLTAGEYVITGASTDGKEEFAMLNTIGGSGAKTYINRKETAETIEDGSIVVSDASIVWTLAQDGSAWTISQEGFGFVYYSGSENSAGSEAEASDKSKWTISAGEDGLFAVVNVATEGRNLRYNSGSPRFACYAPSSSGSLTGKALAFYKKAGETGLSVTLDKANGFTVDLGTADSITAIAKNGAEPYEYVWSSDTAELNGTGETLAIPATLAEGDYTVQVEVTDAESNKASKQIGFSVVAPAVKYAVNVDEDIANGSVSADKEQAEADELVTLTASPAAGFKLGTFLLDGEAISGNTFNMPAKDVLVSATFVEKPVVAGFTKITSLDELTEGEYVLVGSDTNGAYGAVAELTGSTKVLSAAAVTIEDDTVVDAEESQIWTLAQVEGGWTIYNEALGFLGYSGSQNSAMAEAEASEKSTWTFSVAEGELFKVANVGTEGRTLRYNYNKGNMRFACYTSDTLPNIGLYKGSSGPAVPSVSLSASATEVEVNEPVTITATAKNFSAEPEWSWTGKGTADGATFAVDTTVAGVYEVTATATAGEETASKSVTITVSEPAQKYAVTVEQAIGGTIAVDKPEAEAGETVTVTATADDGMRLVAITVNGNPIEGTSFEMPAEPVTVSATFEEFEVPPYYFQFETGANIAYAATEAELDNTGATSAEVPTVGFNVQRVTRGKDAGDKVVGTYALRLAPIGETNAFAYNSKAFTEALTAISFQYGIYGTGDKCDSFTVSTSEDGAEWTVLADLTESATTELQTFASELPANTLFIRFDATSTVKGNSRRMCIDEIQLFTGAPKPSIGVSGETTVKIPGSFSLQFAVKNYEGTVEWAVASREGGSIDASGLYTWTPSDATDGIDITVKATGEGLELEKTVTLVVEAADPDQPALVCDQGATASVAVGATLTLTFTAQNFEVAMWNQQPEEGDFQGDEGSQTAEWTWTPAEAGTSEITVSAYDTNYDEYSCTVTVTVTGEGPQPGGAAITAISVDSKAKTVTLTLSEPNGTVQTTKDLVNGPWTPYPTAATDGTLVIPMGDDSPVFFGNP